MSKHAFVSHICPDTSGMHSPPNAKGNCDWCGGHIASPAPRPTTFPEASGRELDYWYGLMWDPDYPDRLAYEESRSVYEQGRPLGHMTPKPRGEGRDEQSHT